MAEPEKARAKESLHEETYVIFDKFARGPGRPAVDLEEPNRHTIKGSMNDYALVIKRLSREKWMGFTKYDIQKLKKNNELQNVFMQTLFGGIPLVAKDSGPLRFIFISDTLGKTSENVRIWDTKKDSFTQFLHRDLLTHAQNPSRTRQNPQWIVVREIHEIQVRDGRDIRQALPWKIKPLVPTNKALAIGADAATTIRDGLTILDQLFRGERDNLKTLWIAVPRYGSEDWLRIPASLNWKQFPDGNDLSVIEARRSFYRDILWRIDDDCINVYPAGWNPEGIPFDQWQSDLNNHLKQREEASESNNGKNGAGSRPAGQTRPQKTARTAECTIQTTTTKTQLEAQTKVVEVPESWRHECFQYGCNTKLNRLKTDADREAHVDMHDYDRLCTGGSGDAKCLTKLGMLNSREEACHKCMHGGNKPKWSARTMHWAGGICPFHTSCKCDWDHLSPDERKEHIGLHTNERCAHKDCHAHLSLMSLEDQETHKRMHELNTQDQPSGNGKRKLDGQEQQLPPSKKTQSQSISKLHASKPQNPTLATNRPKKLNSPPQMASNTDSPLRETPSGNFQCLVPGCYTPFDFLMDEHQAEHHQMHEVELCDRNPGCATNIRFLNSFEQRQHIYMVHGERLSRSPAIDSTEDPTEEEGAICGWHQHCHCPVEVIKLHPEHSDMHIGVQCPVNDCYAHINLMPDGAKVLHRQMHLSNDWNLFNARWKARKARATSGNRKQVAAAKEAARVKEQEERAALTKAHEGIEKQMRTLEGEAESEAESETTPAGNADNAPEETQPIEDDVDPDPMSENEYSIPEKPIANDKFWSNNRTYLRADDMKAFAEWKHKHGEARVPEGYMLTQGVRCAMHPNCHTDVRKMPLDEVRQHIQMHLPSLERCTADPRCKTVLNFMNDKQVQRHGLMHDNCINSETRIPRHLTNREDLQDPIHALSLRTTKCPFHTKCHADYKGMGSSARKEHKAMHTEERCAREFCHTPTIYWKAGDDELHRDMHKDPKQDAPDTDRAVELGPGQIRTKQHREEFPYSNDWDTWEPHDNELEGPEFMRWMKAKGYEVRDDESGDEDALHSDGPPGRDSRNKGNVNTKAVTFQGGNTERDPHDNTLDSFKSIYGDVPLATPHPSTAKLPSPSATATASRPAASAEAAEQSPQRAKQLAKTVVEPPAKPAKQTKQTAKTSAKPPIKPAKPAKPRKQSAKTSAKPAKPAKQAKQPAKTSAKPATNPAKPPKQLAKTSAKPATNPVAESKPPSAPPAVSPAPASKPRKRLPRAFDGGDWGDKPPQEYTRRTRSGKK